MMRLKSYDDGDRGLSHGAGALARLSAPTQKRSSQAAIAAAPLVHHKFAEVLLQTPTLPRRLRKIESKEMLFSQ